MNNLRSQERKRRIVFVITGQDGGRHVWPVFVQKTDQWKSLPASQGFSEPPFSSWQQQKGNILGSAASKLQSLFVFKCHIICSSVASRSSLSVNTERGGNVWGWEQICWSLRDDSSLAAVIVTEFWEQTAEQNWVVHIVSRSFCSSLLVFQSFRLNNRSSCWHFPPENTTAETAMCFLLRATLQQQQQPFCWHAEWLMPVVTFRWCWVAGCSAEETPTASTVVRFIIISSKSTAPSWKKHLFCS